MSRYENGWGRFELYTLRKLATALGCRLAVRLERPARPARKVGRAEAARKLKRLFWDHDLSPRDFDRHGVWILERVLEYGSLEDVRLLIDLMGREAFLDGACEARYQSARARNFWMRMLEREGRSCTKRSSPGRAWNY